MACPTYTPGFTSRASTISVPVGAVKDDNIDLGGAWICCRGGTTTSLLEYSLRHRSFFFLVTITAGRPSMNSCFPPKSHMHRCFSNQSTPIITSSTSGDTNAKVSMLRSFSVNGTMASPDNSISEPLAAQICRSVGCIRIRCRCTKRLGTNVISHPSNKGLQLRTTSSSRAHWLYRPDELRENFPLPESQLSPLELLSPGNPSACDLFSHIRSIR